MTKPKRLKCNKCERPIDHCYCSKLTNISIKNQVLIIRHKDEISHPFNTAKIAQMQFDNINIIESNDPNLVEKVQDFIEKYNPFLLFKTHLSSSLESDESNKSYQNFIALDGTWNKAKSIFLTHKFLQDLPILHLNEDSTYETIYRVVRRACTTDAISTLEAITTTLSYLNEREYQQALGALEVMARFQIIEKDKKKGTQ